MCRVRIYLADEERDAPVAIYSETPTNQGSLISESAEIIAARILETHRLHITPIFIEHQPSETGDNYEDTFELVVFNSYEIKERRASYLGDAPTSIGSAIRKEIDRQMVEVLVGRKV